MRIDYFSNHMGFGKERARNPAHWLRGEPASTERNRIVMADISGLPLRLQIIVVSPGAVDDVCVC